jgi:hypothetical protein
VFNFVIEPEILEYLKSRNLIVNLITYNKSNYLLESAEFTSEDECAKNLIGTAKIKLNDIISNTDFLNKNIQVVSRISPNTNLGHINIDMKLENTNALSTDVKKVETKKGLENLRTILKNKNEKNLDGKFYFVIRLSDLIFDESFNKKIQAVSKNDFNTRLYFLYKLGKNIKKITPFYQIGEKIFNDPNIYHCNLSYLEVFELNLAFSSKIIYLYRK